MAKISYGSKTKYIGDNKIRTMSYNQLGKALTSGELTEKRLKEYYDRTRRIAMGRANRTAKTSEFGPIEKQYFTKLRNLTTTSSLLHEIADVNRYLNSASSTIGGLRQRRDKQLASLERHGFDFVNESNYGDWVRFMQWFQSSEFSAYYDSNDNEVAEAFDAAESATPAEWSAILKSFLGSGVTDHESIERR